MAEGGPGSCSGPLGGRGPWELDLHNWGLAGGRDPPGPFPGLPGLCCGPLPAALLCHEVHPPTATVLPGGPGAPVARSGPEELPPPFPGELQGTADPWAAAPLSLSATLRPLRDPGVGTALLAPQLRGSHRRSRSCLEGSLSQSSSLSRGMSAQILPSGLFLSPNQGHSRARGPDSQTWFSDTI